MRIEYIYPVISTSIWGVSIVLAKIIGELGFSPTEITFGRFFIASVIFLPILLRGIRKREDFMPRGRSWIDVIALSLTGVSVNNLIFYLGLSMTSASVSSLLVSLNPLMAMLFGALLLKESITRKKMFSVLLGIVGVVLIVGISEDRGSLNGNLLILAAVTIWGSSFSFSKRASNAKIASMAITAWSEIIGTLMLFPVILINNSLGTFGQISSDGFMLFLFLGAISSVIAYALHYRAIEVLGSGKVAPSINIIPFSGAFAAWLILDETLGLSSILGLSLILIAVIIVYRDKST